MFTPIAALPPALTLLSPSPWQVVQRETREKGYVWLSGRFQGSCDRIEFRVRGKSTFGKLDEHWHTVKIEDTGAFNRRFEVPAGGWFKLEARALRGKAVVAVANVDKFGVGEVFVGAGQSNSTNSGQFKTVSKSGMVSSFSGSAWQRADDPQPGTHDNSNGGSFWPAFGDALSAKLNVPIGVATTGHGGTSVNQWQPGGELFNWTGTRLTQLGRGGFRALLWHQGESDVAMTSQEYETKLEAIITGMRTSAGWDFPFFVAQVSYHNPENPRFETTRTAQRRLWERKVASPGPDTDILGGDHRDYDGKGIHFSVKGLTVHGEMWADMLYSYLKKAL